MVTTKKIHGFIMMCTISIHFMVIDWQLIAPSCLDKIDIHHSLINYSLFDDQTTVTQLFQLKSHVRFKGLNSIVPWDYFGFTKCRSSSMFLVFAQPIFFGDLRLLNAPSVGRAFVACSNHSCERGRRVMWIESSYSSLNWHKMLVYLRGTHMPYL